VPVGVLARANEENEVINKRASSNLG